MSRSKHRPLWVAVTILVVLPLKSPFADHGIQALIADYVRVVLDKEREPSLADYYRFEGEATESELGFVLSECRRRRWLPADRNVDCLNYQKIREATRTTTPSLYLRWLRTKLPLGPASVRIVEMIERREPGVLPHDLIKAYLDTREVWLVRTVGENRAAFGELSLSAIDGVRTSELLKLDAIDP